MAIIYVSQNATGLNNGESWQNAYIDLQSALNVATAGDEIWVARGTYLPSDEDDREVSFELKNNVAIYGGFIGNETNKQQRDWENNLTILSGNIGDSNQEADNSYHVVRAENVNDTSILDGFTIADGYANALFS